MGTRLTRLASTAFTLAGMQLREHPARVVYLSVTLAITVAAWLGLSALASPFVDVEAPIPGIMVQNVREGANLPLRYAAQVARMPGALDVGWMNYLPLECKSNVAVTLNAWGGSGAHLQLADVGITSELEAAFNADPLGILVGDTLAAQCGWHAGMNVSPPDAFLGHPHEVHIIGVYHSTRSWGGQIAYAHYSYLNRIVPAPERDRVQFISVRSGNPTDNPALAAHIDAMFAHADPPVDAHTDTGAQNALARFGNVQLLLACVMVAVLLCSTLVLVSVWAHAAAQWRTRLAMLQALGFSRAMLFAGFAMEGVVVGVLGVGLGMVAGFALIRTLAPSLTLILGTFAAPAFAYTMLPAWLAPLLIVAMIAPALLVARTRATDYRAV